MKKNLLCQLALAGIIAGGSTLIGCESSTASADKPAATGITAAKTVTEFQAECTKLGGASAIHDCKTLNSCKGFSFQDGKGVASHECKGHSECKGASCVEPAATPPA